jgi:hypothetical protein
MKLNSKFIHPFVLLISIFSLNACTKESDASSSNVSFEITDAPFDDVNVQGVFVTVAAIKVDGKTIDNFSGKTTIDLAAYQRGQTKVLGNTNLQTGTYSNITLVLDNAADQNGTTPGCYVLTKSGEKKALAATSGITEIVLNGAVKAAANQNSTAVMDFDLRKTIVYDGASNYKFVTSSELTKGVRIVQKAETGVIKGATTNNSATASDKIVVYAYKKGTFNKSTEMQGQGSSSVEFSNAVTSGVVTNGSYELHFLESGDYELHFVSYKDKNSDGKQEIQGEFTASILGNLNLSALSVSANATVTADITLSAILPL